MRDPTRPRTARRAVRTEGWSIGYRIWDMGYGAEIKIKFKMRKAEEFGYGRVTHAS